MRYLILIFIFAALVSGQVAERNILSKRYAPDDLKRALVSKNNWKPYPKTAAEWKEKVPATVLAEIVRRGEAALQKEIPPLPATLILEYVRTGNRSNYEKNSFARRNQLSDLILAESVEDRGRFTDAIANYVWAICEETYWGVPAHLSVQKAKNGLPDSDDPTVDLFGAETVAALALTDYLTGEKLDKVSPLLRKRIYAEANKKIFEPVKQTARYSWLDPKRAVNNWNPWILSNLMEANLLLEPVEAKRAENLYAYMKLLDIYLNGLGADGGCDEGPSYWFAAGGSVFDALETIESASVGRVQVYDEPLIGKMASYIYKMHIADNYFVDFADADPRFGGDGLLLYRFGKTIKDDSLAQFGLYLYERSGRAVGEGFQKPRRLRNLLAVKDLPASKANYTPSREAWFSDIQVLTARAGSGLFLATHAGNNGESHNHNDVGDFIVYLGNEPVIIDAGRGNYTAKTFSSKRYELWFTQSNYHNLPVVGGFGQTAGKEFAANAVKHSSGENESSLSMDIAKAYPKEAGIDFWNRTVRLNRAARRVEITDDYALNKNPESLQQIFMTVCDVDISETGKIKLTTPAKRQITLEYGAGWTATIETPSTEGAEYSSFTAKWNNRPIQRIVLTAASPKTRDRLNYLISIS
ncbi:MAG TPA: heparinase II/III family protein [Pyrinomonadaceae bacterium]|jgi:hypothetical protein